MDDPKHNALPFRMCRIHFWYRLTTNTFFFVALFQPSLGFTIPHHGHHRSSWRTKQRLQGQQQHRIHRRPISPLSVVDNHDDDNNNHEMNSSNAVGSSTEEPQEDAMDNNYNILPFLVDGNNVLSEDPSKIEFVPSDGYFVPVADGSHECYVDDEDCLSREELKSELTGSPFVNMIRGSAPYIAGHRGETAVLYLPGDVVESDTFSGLVDDIALSWLMGLKIILVLDCRSKTCQSQEAVGAADALNGGGDGDASFSYDHAFEYQNSLHVTDEKLAEALRKDLGYAQFELERQLNRALHGSGIIHSVGDQAPDGNVVSSNFYLASLFGNVRGVDYKHTGYPKSVQVEKMQQVLNNNDIVLLTTLGTSQYGDVVSVNGNHLAAFVATHMKASKLIYVSGTEGRILRSTKTHQHLQDVALSTAKSLVEYHQVAVHEAGFASFEIAKQSQEPCALEHLLHMGWATWALQKGVKRAHIVDPKDGALLEELFTATDGANTCIRQDEDVPDDENEFVDEFDVFPHAAMFSEVPQSEELSSFS
mmetsp:Transcript_15242/g.23721  ORF Transcript_15242/g.23721 Transcript_15242/m.23721 type:complete len:535 (+) Transcript_15242:154-1758(+)